MPPIYESGVLFSHDKVTLNYASKKFCTYLLPQILENEKKKPSYHETSLISLFSLGIICWCIHLLSVPVLMGCTDSMISESITLISDQKQYYLTIIHRSGGEWWCLVYTKTADSVEGALSLVISNYLLATSGGLAPEKIVTAADSCRINEFKSSFL